ncbi:MAG: hypothetical protein K6T31_06685, partial [Alicyclobacillus sp.]|nr:hypothetical protein [Alicyclobacillus sp.]
VLDVHYLLLYVPVYVYGIWDSYRSSVDMNKQYLLADREDGPLQPVVMDVVDINYLDQRHPWLAMVWSLLMPGLGHLYTHKVITGFFVLIWWIAMTWRSNLLVALQLTAGGHGALATSVLHPQWLLYMPSIYCFAAYDAYSEAVEYNRLFQKEQARYLRANYQQPTFSLLAGIQRGS